MKIDYNKKDVSWDRKMRETTFPAPEPRDTVEFQVLLVVQALRLIFAFARSYSHPDNGAWGFLQSAYHDEHAGVLYLHYSFGPEVDYSTEVPVVDDIRPGREVGLKLVSDSLRSQVPAEARLAKIRELAQELAVTAFLNPPDLVDLLEYVPAETWSAHASRDLMPQCEKYDMGPLPSVYLDTRINRKPSGSLLLQSSPLRRQSASSSTQNSKSH